MCLSEHWPEPPRRDLGWWDTLPYLAPLVEYRQQAQPHLVVLADPAHGGPADGIGAVLRWSNR